MVYEGILGEGPINLSILVSRGIYGVLVRLISSGWVV